MPELVLTLDAVMNTTYFWQAAEMQDPAEGMTGPAAHYMALKKAIKVQGCRHAFVQAVGHCH